MIAKEIEKLQGAELTFFDLIEKMPPNDGSRQVILNFAHVRLKSVESSLIKSYFSICVGIMIDDHGFDWAFEFEVDLVESLFVAEDEVFNFMSDESFVIEDCVKFLLSDDILASQITGLFNNK